MIFMGDRGANLKGSSTAVTVVTGGSSSTGLTNVKLSAAAGPGPVAGAVPDSNVKKESIKSQTGAVQGNFGSEFLNDSFLTQSDFLPMDLSGPRFGGVSHADKPDSQMGYSPLKIGSSKS